jgi:hypothetical protein
VKFFFTTVQLFHNLNEFLSVNRSADFGYLKDYRISDAAG